MAELYSNFASTLLATAVLNPGDTALAVTPTSGALFPAPPAGDFFRFVMVDSLTAPTKREVLICTARAGDNFTTLLRAQEGTVAQTWVAGNFIAMRVTAGMLNQLVTASSAAALRADLASAASPLVGAGMIGFRQTSNGAAFLAQAVAYSLIAKLSETRSLMDYVGSALIGNDYTAALTALIADAPATGCRCILPPGQIGLTSVTVNKPIYFEGSGQFSGGTAIYALDANSDVFNVTSPNVYFSNLFFDVVPVQVTGSFIRFNVGSSRCAVWAVQMVNWRRGIRIDGVSDFSFNNMRLLNGVPATGVGFHFPSGIHIRMADILVDNAPGFEPAAGLLTPSLDDCTMDGVSFLHCVNGARFEPGDGQVITSVNCDSCFFDNNTGNGARLAPAHVNGTIHRFRFDNCWFGSNAAAGCLLDTNAIVGTIDGVSFNDPQAHDNGAHGIRVTGTGCRNITFDKGKAAGNTGSGVLVENGPDNVLIDGITSGPCDGFGPNTAYGVDNSVGVSNAFRLINSNLSGNGIAGFAPGATGTDRKIKENVGWVTENNGAGTFGAADVVVVIAHGLSIVPTLGKFVINWGETTTTNIDGWWIDTIDATNFSLNLKVAPGASGLDFAWSYKD